MIKRIIVTLIAGLVCTAGFAQKPASLETEVSTTYAVKKGRTLPVNQLKKAARNDTRKKKFYKSNTVIPRNFNGRFKNRVIDEDKANNGADVLRQTSIDSQNEIIIEPILNFDGLTSGSSPNDPTGDVGEEYYMHAINATTIAIYNKVSGVLVDQFEARTLWNSLGFDSGGDPIIMYDQEYKRWIITEFPSGFDASFNQLLVAVSVTSDPMGAYDVYNFNTPNFPDYPKYSIWSNCYAVTTNELSGGVLHGYFINRDELLAGEEVVNIQRVSLPGNGNTEAGFFVATPVDWTGKTPPPSDRGPILLSLNDSSWNENQDEDQLEIFSLDLDWDNSDNTSWTRLSLEVSPYDGYPCAASGFFFSCIPQPATIGLDGIPEVIMHQAHYRNFGSHESIVLNFITDATDGEDLAGIRWMELRRSSSEDWSVYQEGTFAPDDGLNRFMGSIAMDGSGNIALAYNVANESTFAGIRFTGRRAGDPLGEMTVQEYTVIEGNGPINNGSRFGDYAHMAIDPFNDRTFWYTSEYGSINGSKTRIVSYEMSRDSIDLGVIAINSPVTSPDLEANETVEVVVKNQGLFSVRNYSVSYELDGVVVTEEIDMTLSPDSIHVIAFAQTVDLSEVRDYALKAYTSLERDTATFNDTLSLTITHIPDVELALGQLDTEKFTICGTEAALDLQLFNLGGNDITSASFEIFVNGNSRGMINYAGQLEFDGSELFQLAVEDLDDGINDIEVRVVSVNGQSDFDDMNNSSSIQINAIVDGDNSTLSITFDNYPAETSWSLEDENGNLIAEGGNYDSSFEMETIEVPVCLDPDLCYVFTLRDSYGDGIIFGEISGDYQIITEDNVVLASLINPEFGSEERNEFCTVFECNIELSSSVSHPSAPDMNDGVLMIDVLSGLGPFSYSIDGGATVQNENVFDGLTEGSYEIIVYGANSCSETIIVELTDCDLEVAYNLTSESDIGAQDGIIEILVVGSNGPYDYSIDGGQTILSDSLFESLVADTYSLFVQDRLGCVYEELVRISNTVSTGDITVGKTVKIYPNPTQGIITVELTGFDQIDYMIPVALYNLNGQLIQKAQLARYNDKHIGVMSLYHYPQGQYFLRLFTEEDSNKLHKVVRQ